jgi:hypothetical protein
MTPDEKRALSEDLALRFGWTSVVLSVDSYDGTKRPWVQWRDKTGHDHALPDFCGESGFFLLLREMRERGWRSEHLESSHYEEARRYRFHWFCPDGPWEHLYAPTLPEAAALAAQSALAAEEAS